MSVILIVLSLIISYLIGSIPTSFLFGKFTKKIDIREFGSGNVGATNAYRTLGKIPGVMVLIIDILKGYVVAGILADLFYKIPFIEIDFNWLRVLMGLAAICGHIWTIFLKFKGGKGIATGIGVLLAISPALFIAGVVIWFAAFMPFKYISFASVITIILLPFIAIVLNKPLPIIMLTITTCIIGTYKHMSNIKRLFRGEEHKFGEKIDVPAS